MATAAIMTTWLNVVFLALTPVQRWEALNKQFNTDYMTDRWFTLALAVIIIVATVLLIMVSYKRKVEERAVAQQLFGEYAEKRGLSGRERRVLEDIARRAGLKRSESIFTMGGAFDRGATKIIEEDLAQGQTSERISRLKTDLSFLAEKLGFKNRTGSSKDSAAKLRKLGSRQIPIGKKLYLTRRRTRISDDIESTVIENNDIGLTVKLAMSLKITGGEIWRVRYYFGVSVWEFDTSVAGCDRDLLVLNHSADVRFINRRRFLRVPVNKPAFVARFPFTRLLPLTSYSGEEGSEGRQVSAGAWGPPEFIPGVVTELAGPGLRIEAPLKVKVGEKVLVLFRLDEAKDEDSDLQIDEVSERPKVIENTGEVRHVKAIENGFSIAVELTGLNDPDINELIRATNAASVKAGGKGQGTDGSASEEQEATEPAAL
ncbi:MAG: PilZ domain-containing protein [Planctomycetota bacterium]|jgi:hypothetical protein